MRNPMLRTMLGLSLLSGAMTAGYSSIIPEPPNGKRSPDELRADPKLAPAMRAIGSGCTLAHPRSKRCSNREDAHVAALGIRHRLTKSQRRAIREMDAMHRQPGAGRDNG